MNMNWWIMVWTGNFVLMQFLAAWAEGTLTAKGRKKVDMPFLHHPGMWAAALILTPVNGLIWDHITIGRIPVAQDLHPTIGELPEFFSVMVVVGVMITATLWLHILWSKHPATDHIFPDKTTYGKGESAIAGIPSVAGLLHMAFMVCEMTIITFFVLSPAPADVVWAVAILLTVFTPTGTFLVCKVKTGVWADMTSIVTSIVMVVLIWGTYLAKT